MKIRLGVIGEAENIDIFREVIEEYNDYEIATFIDADGTHTLNIIDTHQQEFDSWLVFDQINYLYKSLSTTFLTAVPAFIKHYALLFTKALKSMN